MSVICEDLENMHFEMVYKKLRDAGHWGTASERQEAGILLCFGVANICPGFGRGGAGVLSLSPSTY